MAVTDHERNAAGRGADRAGLFGPDRLGSVKRTLVERGMGADRQRHHACESDRNGDGAAGDAELTEIHRVTIPSFIQGTKQDRASSSHEGLFSFEGVTGYVTTNCADFAALQ